MPVLPLRRGKVPFGNCTTCADNACGGRPDMKIPGPCRCAGVCHAWAAATTDPAVIVSPPWATAWRRAVCVGYHPGGAGLTVVDLDNADAIAWAPHRHGDPDRRMAVADVAGHVGLIGRKPLPEQLSR